MVISSCYNWKIIDWSCCERF